jgi:hypothetical protein
MGLNSAQEPDDGSDKKTTIQLFSSTTKDLTQYKHGNDTYDDVINRMMSFYAEHLHEIPKRV